MQASAAQNIDHSLVEEPIDDELMLRFQAGAVTKDAS
jgi:hypothetical protein